MRFGLVLLRGRIRARFSCHQILLVAPRASRRPLFNVPTSPLIAMVNKQATLKYVRTQQTLECALGCCYRFNGNAH